jgi:UDP:flavonoid glycosyltransferase YjiC (YdhE family)
MTWRPTPALVEFLDHGPPPIYVGFGSTRPGDERWLTETVLSALRRTGQRAVLGLGWGGLRPDLLTADVYAVDDIPLGWLFPRVAAVVHHGGAGTTALGLRAGLPTVTVPFFADQPFWARRVRSLGVGPAPIAYRRLTGARLTRAIETALYDAEMRARARALGATLRAEDGCSDAVAAVDDRFRHGPRPTAAPVALAREQIVDSTETP